ncbi:MAG: class I SAM-dependent methyltransferase family protein [bacterium]
MKTNPHQKVNVVLDKDASIGHETNSLGKKLLNLFLIPTLNSIPASFRGSIRKSHASADEVIENATTHKALEVLYHNGHPHRSKNVFQKISHHIWFHSNNSRGVRNRLRIVTRELKHRFTQHVEQEKPIKVLSIASGSSRAVIEALRDAQTVGKLPISGVFLDKNPVAIDYSKQLAKEMLKDQHSLEWAETTVGTFFRECQPENEFDVVEMVGLLDYFNDAKTIETFTSIRKALKPGGILVTANIADNPERTFVTKAIGWDMIYRKAEDLAHLLGAAGFEYDKMKVFYEPLKVHSVIVAEK